MFFEVFHCQSIPKRKFNHGLTQMDTDWKLLKGIRACTITFRRGSRQVTSESRLLKKILLKQAHEPVNREHQFALSCGGVRGAGQINGSAHDFGVTHHDRKGFIVVPGLAQENAHFFGHDSGARDCFQRGVRVEFACACALQQTAFERAAIFGAVRVNGAKFSIKARAGLGEREHGLALFHGIQSQRCEMPWVIAPFQFHIREQHAVAAKPAIWAEPGDGVIALILTHE